MKQNVLFALVAAILLCNSNSFALDQLGPPAATLDKGEWELGVDYSFSELDVKFEGSNLFVSPDTKFDNTKMNKAYIHFGCGITDRLDLLLRLGWADMDVKEDEDEVGSLIGDSNSYPTFGVGVKLTFIETEDLKCGALAALSFGRFDNFPGEDVYRRATGDRGVFSPEIELSEGQIAVGAIYHLTKRISIYGGPFLHFFDGDVELTILTRGRHVKETSDMKEDSPYGGYVGMRLIILNSDFHINFSGTRGGWGIGTQWVYRF